MSKDIVIRLGAHMYNDIVNVPLLFRMDYIIDNVIRSQNHSKFQLQ